MNRRDQTDCFSPGESKELEATDLIVDKLVSQDEKKEETRVVRFCTVVSFSTTLIYIVEKTKEENLEYQVVTDNIFQYFVTIIYKTGQRSINIFLPFRSW